MDECQTRLEQGTRHTFLGPGEQGAKEIILDKANVVLDPVVHQQTGGQGRAIGASAAPSAARCCIHGSIQDIMIYIRGEENGLREFGVREKTHEQPRPGSGAQMIDLWRQGSQGLRSTHPSPFSCQMLLRAIIPMTWF